MLILSFISSGLEPWSVNHTSIYEYPKWKVFKNIKYLGEISNNWLKHLLETNVYKTWILLITFVDNIKID